MSILIDRSTGRPLSLYEQGLHHLSTTILGLLHRGELAQLTENHEFADIGVSRKQVQTALACSW